MTSCFTFHTKFYCLFFVPQDEDSANEKDKDSVVEFGEMLAQAEDESKEDSMPSTAAPVKKVKVKIGGKNKTKMKLKVTCLDEDAEEFVRILFYFSIYFI